MVDVWAESMVGGTILREKITTASDWREISRVLVLKPLWRKSGAKNTDRISLSLTPPSLLSRGTRPPAMQIGPFMSRLTLPAVSAPFITPVAATPASKL